MTPTIAELKEQTPLAFRLNDAAKLIGLSRGSLYNLHKAGRLKMITLAGRTLIPADEVKRLIETAPKLTA